ncbi:hypothetical protein B0O99DRAFT_117666 [Bisporella sp. PMI_857]|nr:hypothetical protein B0O99DRAFT_117666 [Bisporella sp. PMI_857]
MALRSLMRLNIIRRAHILNDTMPRGDFITLPTYLQVWVEDNIQEIQRKKAKQNTTEYTTISFPENSSDNDTAIWPCIIQQIDNLDDKFPDLLPSIPSDAHFEAELENFDWGGSQHKHIKPDASIVTGGEIDTSHVDSKAVPSDPQVNYYGSPDDHIILNTDRNNENLNLLKEFKTSKIQLTNVDSAKSHSRNHGQKETSVADAQSVASFPNLPNDYVTISRNHMILGKAQSATEEIQFEGQEDEISICETIPFLQDAFLNTKHDRSYLNDEADLSDGSASMDISPTSPEQPRKKKTMTLADYRLRKNAGEVGTSVSDINVGRKIKTTSISGSLNSREIGRVDVKPTGKVPEVIKLQKYRQDSAISLEDREDGELSPEKDLTPIGRHLASPKFGIQNEAKLTNKKQHQASKGQSSTPKHKTTSQVFAAVEARQRRAAFYPTPGSAWSWDVPPPPKYSPPPPPPNPPPYLSSNLDNTRYAGISKNFPASMPLHSSLNTGRIGYVPSYQVSSSTSLEKNERANASPSNSHSFEGNIIVNSPNSFMTAKTCFIPMNSEHRPQTPKYHSPSQSRQTQSLWPGSPIESQRYKSKAIASPAMTHNIGSSRNGTPHLGDSPIPFNLTLPPKPLKVATSSSSRETGTLSFQDPEGRKAVLDRLSAEIHRAQKSNAAEGRAMMIVEDSNPKSTTITVKASPGQKVVDVLKVLLGYEHDRFARYYTLKVIAAKNI